MPRKNAKGEWTNLYISGECWEKQAEFVNQYFKEGSVAIVTGKLYTNVYEKNDGTKVYENKLLFPNVGFAPKDRTQTNNTEANKAPQQSHNQQPQQSYQAPQQSYNQQPQQQAHTDYREPQRAMPDANALPSFDIDESTLPF